MLYEQADLRIEGRIIVKNFFAGTLRERKEILEAMPLNCNLFLGIR